MRHGYWWIEALLGLVLVIAPFVEKFTEIRTAAYTDVIVGVLLLVWALVGYWRLGDMKAQRMHPTQA
jgi:zinc transporter ZupT